MQRVFAAISKKSSAAKREAGIENVWRIPADSRALVGPSPVIGSGFEIGIATAYPSKSIAEDYPYAEPHLIKDSYLADVPQLRTFLGFGITHPPLLRFSRAAS